MALELVTGKAGAPHIEGNDIGTINQATRGKGSYVLEWGDEFAARVTGSNSVQIGTGCASMEGRDFIINSPETVTITSGSQGMKRNDLICAHYHRDGSTGVETMGLTVIKGTAVSSNPADPNVPSGTIMGGSIDAYWKLYRVPLDGITMGTPIQLFSKLPSIKTVGDSITPSDWSKLSPSITYRKVSGIVFVMADHLNISQAQTKIQVGQLPVGYRPGTRPQAQADDSYAAVGTLNSRSDGQCGVIGVNAEGVVFISANTTNSHFAGEVVYPALA